MVEPVKVFDALEDPDWVLAMHEELNNFKRNDVWTLMKRSDHCRNVIDTKWVFKNKQDEHGIVIRNKARLVAKVTQNFKAWTLARHSHPLRGSSPSVSF
jgi:hypothetical protein